MSALQLCSALTSGRPMAFLSELATNASAKNVGIVFYSGNDDALVGHKGTQSEEYTLLYQS